MKRKLEFWIETEGSPLSMADIQIHVENHMKATGVNIEWARNSHWDGQTEWTRGDNNDAGNHWPAHECKGHHRVESR